MRINSAPGVMRKTVGLSHWGGVAHRSEQAAHNHLVVGSTPTTPTKEKTPKEFQGCFFYFSVF